MGFGNGMGFGMGFGGFWMIFWLVGLIALVIWLVKLMFPQNSQASEGAKSLEIAQRRYARGEISAEEFESLKRELT